MSVFGVRTQRNDGGNTGVGYSVVDDRMLLRGDIETDGTIRVDGRVEGHAHRAGTLIVGAGGGVIGNVDAREVIVAGTIEGNVTATQRIEIESGAAVHGEIRAGAMLLHDGGAINGRMAIGVAAPAPADESAPPRRSSVTPISNNVTPISSSRARG